MGEGFQSMMQSIAQFLLSSPANDLALYLLRNIPGFPPIIQTFHIVSVAIVMASAVLINLRVLGIAVRGQQINELQQRMAPWFWSALVVLPVSGLVFVCARPLRYFSNPVFGIKMACLLMAVVSVIFIFRFIKSHSLLERPSFGFKCLNLFSLTLWITIVLAGRWVAYSDYLFGPGA